ncbi:MAG: ATP-binding protein [Candidatus Sulfotelmatobacter sp.]
MPFDRILREVSERKRAKEMMREQTRMMDLSPVLVRDMENRIVAWNQGAEGLYGYSSLEVKGQVSHDLLQTRFPMSEQAAEEALRRDGRWEGELSQRKKDGSQVAVASLWVLYRDGQGRPVRILETATDISARKRAEQRLAGQAEELARQAEELARSEQAVRRLNDDLEHRVAERTEQLETANKDLEAFTYSVSHDLRAPLRHISGFTKILTEEFGPSLPSEAQHYLQRVEQGARQMGELVDGLLHLARVGRQALAVEVTGLGAVVNDVLTMLEPEMEGRQVDWKIGELPFLECDPILVRQVFQNLIGNALKFTRPRSPAVIEIGQREENGQTVIFVRDNGVGFSMKYADKLFGVFQRLHRAEDFEGTGVGLATVQKVIQKHGGWMWAEAKPDHGATFYFTLGGRRHCEATRAAAEGGGG